MIDTLHRKVEGHELANWPQPVEGGTDGQPGETHFRDGGVDDPLAAVLFPQAAGHLSQSDAKILMSGQLKIPATTALVAKLCPEFSE